MTGRDHEEHKQFTKSFKIKYSTNGIDWVNYNGGEVIKGPQTHRDTIRHKLIPFKALSVRIYP